MAEPAGVGSHPDAFAGRLRAIPKANPSAEQKSTSDRHDARDAVHPRESIRSNQPFDLRLGRFLRFDKDLVGGPGERNGPTVEQEDLHLAAADRVAEDRQLLPVLTFQLHPDRIGMIRLRQFLGGEPDRQLFFLGKFQGMGKPFVGECSGEQPQRKGPIGACSR